MAQVTTHIGMRVDELQRRADTDLKLYELRDDSPIVIERPATLNYASGERIIAFPETEMIWIGQIAAVVVDITFAPQRQALPVRRARELAISVARQVGDGGWSKTVDGETLIPSEAVLTQWVLSRPEHSLFKRTIGEWHSGTTKLSMTLKELFTEGSRTPGNIEDVRFLVNLYFSDLQLRIRQRKQLVERRKQKTASEEQQLPLSAWLR